MKVDINQIKHVKNAMTGVDPESAQNMLLALLLDAYWEGRRGVYNLPDNHDEIIQTFVDGTR